MASKKNKNNDKEEIVIKKSTIIGVAIALVVIFILILNLGKIDNLFKAAENSIRSDVIAEVNGEKITSNELDKSYDFFFFITGYPEEFKQFLTKEQFLDQMIAEKLLLQEVKKEEIELSEGEFNQLKEQAFGQSNLSEDSLVGLLEINNITLDYFMEYYKKQVLITKLLNQTIVDRIKVSAEDIETYYESNKADYENLTLKEASESIKILLTSLKQRDALRDYITELKNQSDIKIYPNTEEKTTALAPFAAKKTSNECIKKYGISDNTIVFYHASWCPHCQNMMPVVKELEEEGFSFIWVDTEDQASMNIIKDCFNDVVGQGIPEFFCAGTKEMKLGALSKEQLKNFAEKCVSSV